MDAVIKQVLLAVDSDEITDTLDRLENRSDEATAVGENQQLCSRIQGMLPSS